MEAKTNMTYIILGGFVEVQRYRYLYFMIMLTAYLVIISFNISIVCLIIVHKSLHEPMYVFIAALLINSILFSTNIYPKLFIDFLSERQVIPYQACLFQIFAFYSLSGSEFLLLAAMAYDRYVSICKPLRYPSIMTKTTVSALLVLAWFVPACHVSVSVILSSNKRLCSYTINGIFCNNAGHGLYCVNSPALSVFGVVVLFNVGFLPMLFILFTYARIMVVAYQSGREVRRKAAQTCLPHLLVLINYSILITYDVVIVKLETDVPKMARLVMTLQIFMYNPLCNPLIYGIKMKEISKHLKRLFCQTKWK
ncbi:PREDICTED: olfactory receptor-like protein COR2 [Poecilia mexicana]|uniref:olfactory receptor-like protein COR2 n=1 Tax=Poecilia mexicana TaxID=48701 RepID=UPI00072EC072|nr:PREDICTED: olfactory receptor-like protein COR2 [Poecilia mexicana]